MRPITVRPNETLIISNGNTPESEWLQKLLSLSRERWVIYEEREEIMRLFLKIYLRRKADYPKFGIRKLAQILEFLFDFRHADNPERTLSTQSLETQLHNLKQALEGREE